MKTTNELIKKDSAIIKELTVKFSRYYGYVLIILTMIFNIIQFIISFAKDNTDIYYLSGYLCCMMPMLSDIMILNGTSPYTGISKKSAGAARENFKGSANILDTLYCIPIRKSSVFRYQFKWWSIISAVAVLPCIFVGINGICGKAFSPIIFIFLTFTTIFRAVMFFTIFLVTFRSKAIKRIINVLYLAGCISFAAIMIIGGFCTMIGDLAKLTVNAISPLSGGALTAASAVMLILSAALIPAMYIIYNKIILNRTGGGWYE